MHLCDLIIFFILISVKPSCLEIDVGLADNDIKVIHSVSSWGKCQLYCETEGPCLFWSFKNSNGNCWLKTSDAGRRSHAGTISGAKKCGASTGGMILSTNQLLLREIRK